MSVRVFCRWTWRWTRFCRWPPPAAETSSCSARNKNKCKGLAKSIGRNNILITSSMCSVRFSGMGSSLLWLSLDEVASPIGTKGPLELAEDTCENSCSSLMAARPVWGSAAFGVQHVSWSNTRASWSASQKNTHVRRVYVENYSTDGTFSPSILLLIKLSMNLYSLM